MRFQSIDISLIEKLRLETGDLLLFTSKGKWYDRFLNYFTASTLTHIGIILKNPTYIDEKLTGYYLLESGMEPFPDSEDNKYKFGVQISDLNKIFDEYTNGNNGNLFFRRLHCVRDTQFYEKIKITYERIKNAPYDLNPLDWISADLKLNHKINIGNNYQIKHFWCSALVGYFYYNLDFIDKNIGWSYLAPCQFSSNDNRQLDFKDCSLSNDKIIQFNKYVSSG